MCSARAWASNSRYDVEYWYTSCSAVFALGTEYSGFFWCAFRLHNQSQNMRHFYTAQCKTLVNIENVQIKPITLPITKRFAFLFGTAFIRTAMYSVWGSHTVPNQQRMLSAFCVSPLFDHYANKVRVQTIVQTAPANNGLRLLWSVSLCVCMVWLQLCQVDLSAQFVWCWAMWNFNAQYIRTNGRAFVGTTIWFPFPNHNRW